MVSKLVFLIKILIFSTIWDFLALFLNTKIYSSIFFKKKNLLFNNTKYLLDVVQSPKGLMFCKTFHLILLRERLGIFFHPCTAVCCDYCYIFCFLCHSVLLRLFATLSFFFQVTDNFENFVFVFEVLPSTNVTLLPEIDACKKITVVN